MAPNMRLLTESGRVVVVFVLLCVVPTSTQQGTLLL